MKHGLSGLAAAAFFVLPALAMAQDGNVIAVPPPPPIVAAPATPLPIPPPPAAPPPGGLVQTPLPPVYSGTGDNTGANADNGNAAPPAAVASPDAPPASPNEWVPKQTAVIGVLNKVDGSIADVTIPVGGQSTIGDLQVSVLACAIRPPNEVPDAAVFLSAAAPNNPSAPPVYRGWMVRSLPGATVVGNASATFRVVGCS